MACLALCGCRSAESYLERGDRLFAQGRYADASLNYKNSIKKRPRWGEPHYRLGLAELRQQDWAAAIREFQAAVEFSPERTDFRVELADAALGVYQADRSKPKALYDTVAATAEYLLKKDPNSPDGLRLRGHVQVLDGRPEDALATFRRANAIKPDDAYIALGLTELLFQSNQAAEGEALAKRCLGQHKEFGLLYDVLLKHYVQTKQMAEAENVLKSKAANLPKDAAPILQLASFYRQYQGEREMSQALQKILGNPADFPNGHMMVGDFYAGFGQWDDALEQYKQGLQSNERIVYLKKVAKVYVAVNKPDEAIAALDEVLKIKPDDLDARVPHAMLLEESGDAKKLDLAITELKSLLQQVPNNPLLRYSMGMAMLAKGDAKAGRAQLAESARLAKGYLRPRMVLAELALKSRDYGEAIRIAGEILAVDPKNPEARLWRAEGLLATQAYAEARAELDGLHRQYPDSANVNLNLAFLAAAEKRYRDAESQYLRLYQPGQKDLRPLEGLIQVYGAEQQIDKGLKLTEEEVKAAPDSRPARLLLAATAIRSGKLDLAIQQYEWLLSNDPKSVEAYASLGEVYQLKGDLNGALTSFQKARELAPNNPKILAMVALLQGATGQSKEAIASLRQQLAVKPDDGSAMNNLAYALAESGTDLDEAQSLAEKAQRQLPDNAQVADTLGWVYVKKGLNESAIKIFNGLLRQYPEVPVLRYHLGVALLQAGKLPEAKAEFIIGLSKKPPKDMADKMKEIVARIG